MNIMRTRRDDPLCHSTSVRSPLMRFARANLAVAGALVMALGSASQVSAQVSAQVDPHHTRASHQTASDANDRRMGHLHELLRTQRAKETADRPNASGFYGNYLDAKDFLARYGITAQIAPTLMNQWGTPQGGKAALQWMFSPTLNWNAFHSDTIGEGSVQFSYSYNRYGNSQSGASLTTRLRAITAVNDTPLNLPSFNQLTYTHVLPGNWLQLTLGQFQFSTFDTNQYANNQQQNFINYALSQNASQAYDTASLGAYAQINPTKSLSFAAGFQDANNVTGQRIQFSTFGNGQYAWFGTAQWRPVIAGMGASQFSLLYYQQPKVPTQMQFSQGWSLNLVQNIDAKWAVFARANTATGAIAPIASSLAGGFIINNPTGGIRGDQIGVGAAWNKTNTAYFKNTPTRPSEFLIETYWNVVLEKVFQIGPSVQVIFNPALQPGAPPAAVFTLRASGLI